MGYFSGRGGNGSFFLSWTSVSPTLHAGVIWKRTKEHSGPEAARKSRSARYEAVGTLARFPHLERLGRKQGTRELVVRGVPFSCSCRLSSPRRGYRNCPHSVWCPAMAPVADRAPRTALFFHIPFEKDFWHN